MTRCCHVLMWIHSCPVGVSASLLTLAPLGRGSTAQSEYCLSNYDFSSLSLFSQLYSYSSQKTSKDEKVEGGKCLRLIR